MITPSDIQSPPFVFPCLIGGRAIDRQERIAVRSPFTGEVVGSVPKLGEDDVLRAMLREMKRVLREDSPS